MDDGGTNMGILAGQTFLESRKEDSDDNVDEPADGMNFKIM